jgi:hypothetical protein
VTFIDTLAFNSSDPEGVGFGAGKLFIADGLNKEVYVVDPGSNGNFDGVPPAGDDQVSHFDVAGMDLRDPEGIDYNPERGTLFIVSRSDKILVEAATSGKLVKTIDISFVKPVSPGGVGCGPGSQDPGRTNIFIADRGVDNADDPNENDGKIYEISIGGSPPSNPTKTARPTNTVEPTATPTPTKTAEPTATPSPTVQPGRRSHLPQRPRPNQSPEIHFISAPDRQRSLILQSAVGLRSGPIPSNSSIMNKNNPLNLVYIIGTYPQPSTTFIDREIGGLA